MLAKTEGISGIYYPDTQATLSIKHSTKANQKSRMENPESQAAL